jgi:tetratricopeptide (TPR) repeat protein
MDVSLARRWGRAVCGVALISSASLVYADDSMVFVGDDEPATSTASSGSIVIVGETSPAATSPADRPTGTAALANGLSLRSQEPRSQQPRSLQNGPQESPQDRQRRPQPQTRQPNIVKSVDNPPELDKAGRLLVEAHTASASAKTETELSEVIDQCIAALRLGVKGENKLFATQLISWALNRRGQLYTDAGKAELADADYQEAIHFDGNNWRAIHNRGVSYAESGKFAEAFDDFNSVIALNPKFAKAYTNRATLFVQAGDLEGAKSDYRQACELDEKLASARLGMARVCHMNGECEEALAHFTAAAKLDPQNPGILCSRGDLLADMGQYADALASYAMAIEVKPDFGHAYRNGAWLLATCPDEQYRDPENSILGAKQALESEYGERHVALDTLAAAYASAGDFEKAVATLEEAIELAPSVLRSDYVSRVKMYEAGQPFRTQPVAEISQAVYEEMVE